MKKSEFVRARGLHWRGEARGQQPVDYVVGLDIAAAEAAGVVWEPEGEPLPERLAHSESSVDERDFLTPASGTWKSKEHRRAGYAEAVRRFNSYRILWELQREMEAHGRHGHVFSEMAGRYARDLAGILSGASFGEAKP